MTRWMATLTFKTQPTAETLALISAEQAHVRELMTQHLMEAIYISSQGTVWLVISGADLAAVKETLQTLPMYSYFNIEIAPLNP